MLSSEVTIIRWFLLRMRIVGGYLENLHELKMTFGIGVYAYCLIAEAVEQIIGRRIERRGPGRPLKSEPEG